MDRWKDLTEIAEAVVDETLAGLPDEIKPFAANVPLQLEKRPSPAMMEEGITEDTLGLFIGESLEDVGSTTTPMPGQIFLFLENIWAFAEHDRQAYIEEVRVTLLHELGHYLGWDEQDLFDRDLD